jgi:hypothetical protein
MRYVLTQIYYVVIYVGENSFFGDAFPLVQQRRFCINPNEGFMAQLNAFE